MIKKRNNNKKISISAKFDYIIVSPGIDIHKCSLSKFLKKNSNKIYTDLDIFYNHHYSRTIIILQSQEPMANLLLLKSYMIVLKDQQSRCYD